MKAKFTIAYQTRGKEIQKEIVYIVSKENPGIMHATAPKSSQEIIT